MVAGDSGMVSGGSGMVGSSDQCLAQLWNSIEIIFNFLGETLKSAGALRFVLLDFHA